MHKYKFDLYLQHLQHSSSAKLSDEGNDYEMIPDVLPATSPMVNPSSLQRLLKDTSHETPESGTNDSPSADPHANFNHPILPHTYSVVDKQKKANARANLEESKDNEKKANVITYSEGANPMFVRKDDIDEATLKEMDIIL